MDIRCEGTNGSPDCVRREFSGGIVGVLGCSLARRVRCRWIY